MHTFANFRLLRVCTDETEASHLGHVSSCAGLLADALDDLVGLEDAPSELGYLAVCGAIIARVTVPVTVGTYLLP